MKKNVAANQNDKTNLVLLGVGIAALLISSPWAIQTILWATSPTWNEPSNAMPLLMVFIIPIAILAFGGIALGLALAILSLIRTNRVGIPESPAHGEFKMIVTRRVVVYSALAICLAFLSQNILNAQLDSTFAGTALLLLVCVTCLAQFTLVGFACYFSAISRETGVYVATGLVLLPTALISFNQLVSALVPLVR